MRLRPIPFGVAVAALVAAAASWPLALEADTSASSVAASSLADTLMNPSEGEDAEFFVTKGGIPNVALVLDTSGSMRRVAPDGAARSWGSFEDPLTRYGCANSFAEELFFQSSCGTTTEDGKYYSGSVDYAQAKDSESRYCGYMGQAGEPMKTDKPGYDPDFYPKFFDKNRVFRDVVGYLPPVGDSGDLTPVRDGWTDTDVNPAPEADVGAFCDRFILDPAKRSSCFTCLTGKGYWFDGSYLKNATEDWRGPACSSTDWCAARGFGMCIKDTGGEKKLTETSTSGRCRIPQIWFTGNHLNFHPPKFLVARKVIKDVLAGVKLFRLGFFTLDSGGAGATQVEELNPPCNQFGGRSSFFNNRNAVRNSINNTSKVNFGGEAALSEALLDLGHLYQTQSLSWFPWPYDDSNFEEKGTNNRSICFACQKSSVILVTDGSPTHDGRVPGDDFANGSPMTATVAAQSGTYLAKAGYNITGITCPTCDTASEAVDPTIGDGQCWGQQISGACNGLHDPIPSYLPKVAWYLHNVDARADDENGADGYPMTKKQALDIFTIGLGVRNQMADLLRDTADAGGGRFFSTNGGRELRKAIDKALEEVSTRSVTFGSASVSTLQASASQSVLIPRFSPSKGAAWDGHVFAYDLWSEFTGGCTIPLSGPSGPANNDYDCDGKCTSVFLRERGSLVSGKWVPGAFIQEASATGVFMVNEPPDRAACGLGNLCSDCADIANSTRRATPYWDVGDQLSPLKADGSAKTSGFKAWWQRSIYTVVDNAAPFGKLTASDSLLKLGTDSATLTKLLPYLNVRGNKRFCEELATRLSGAANPAGATIRGELYPPVTVPATPPTYATCAKLVVQFAMGADVFNSRNRSDFTSAASSDDYWTRAFQLGDVFHSSPVEVWPPLASDGLLCPRGLHSQCLPSAFSPSIPNPSKTGKANAYDDYAKSAIYRHRNKFALFGANDGMLHAVLTGTFQAGKDDPRTPQAEDKAPYDGYHDVGTGEELWAFVPPDLLPKLHLLTLDDHQYFVDGTPMVRDVWIDGGIGGAGNQVGTISAIGTPTKDGIRQGSEFFTVAVVGLRRGGNHYFALDVTDAGNDAGFPGKPRFLWLYPQPDDPEQLAFGETFTDFVPTPPPMGPVRLDGGAAPCASGGGTYADAAGVQRCVEERWIVFLSGGFDPQYTRGRGVHMVDLGTGAELWDFSQPKGAASACGATSDPRCHLNYPVAAPVGMVMWGKGSKYTSSAAIEGYFDTATFGDTGGQLWVLRFNEPGIIDPSTGKVKNWFGARAFQNGLTTSTPECGLDYCGAQPFFHVTANLPLRQSNLYRVLAGTGDRFNLLDPTGGICSPTNLRACLMKGCTVKLDDGTGGDGAVYEVDLLGGDRYHSEQAAACGAFDPADESYQSTAATSSTASLASQRIRKLDIQCPSTNVCTGNTTGETVAKDVAVDCVDGYCAVQGNYDYGSKIELKNDTGKKNWFFSVRVFDAEGDRAVFDDLAGAKRFDAARLNDDALVSVNDAEADPAKPYATADGAGWKYFFDHGDPNATGATVSIDGLDHHIYRSDERVASTTAVEASCAFWNTLQVALPEGSRELSTDCPVNSPCKAGKRQLTYLYGAHPGTGEKCIFVDGALARVQRTQTVVPPQMGKMVAYVASGQVNFALTDPSRGGGGATNISLGEAKDVTSLMHWLPVDRQTEACRHWPRDSATPPPGCK